MHEGFGKRLGLDEPSARVIEDCVEDLVCQVPIGHSSCEVDAALLSLPDKVVSTLLRLGLMSSCATNVSMPHAFSK